MAGYWPPINADERDNASIGIRTRTGEEARAREDSLVELLSMQWTVEIGFLPPLSVDEALDYRWMVAWWMVHRDARGKGLGLALMGLTHSVAERGQVVAGCIWRSVRSRAGA